MLMLVSLVLHLVILVVQSVWKYRTSGKKYTKYTESPCRDYALSSASRSFAHPIMMAHEPADRFHYIELKHLGLPAKWPIA